MYEKLEACPSCKHLKFHNHSIIQDHAISLESFALSQCDNCGLIFTNPRPSEQEISRFYDSDQYISHHNKTNTFTDILYKLVRTRTLKNKITLLNTLSAKSSILDFGCGTGHFLEAAKNDEWAPSGIEPNPTARTQIPDSLQAQVYPTLRELPPSSYEIITAWHVIEHVYELKQTLQTLKTRLTSKGHLIIALPNCASADAKIYKEHWAGYDVPRHLYHFTPKTFAQLSSSIGLRLKKQIPMPYDAFYVSLLSEKYMNNPFPYIKGFLNGYKSNRAANKTGQYSSIIYVLKK